MQGLTDPTTAQWVEQQQRNAFWDAVSQWGYTAWFLTFAVAALFLLLFALIPRENYSTDSESRRGPLSGLSRYRALLLHLGGVMMLVLCAISHQTEVDQTRGMAADRDKRFEDTVKKMTGKDRNEAMKSQYMYLPSGNSLIYMSLGNPSLAADYMWLTSQQYVVNSFRRGQKYELLLRFYNTVLELNPNWVEAAVKGGKVLSALEQNRYAVENFYISAITKNPGDLELPYEAGRLFVVPPLNLDQRRDFAKHATDWFNMVIGFLRKQPESDERNKRILSVQDLITRMAVETDAYELAVEFLWKNLTDEKASKTLRQISSRDWLNARSLVIASKLQEGVDQYRVRNFFRPILLRPIVEEMRNDKLRNGEHVFLNFDRDGMPRDAFGYAIDYNPMTGVVLSHGVAAKQAIQAASVIQAVIAAYRNENDGAAPPDLNALQNFVTKFYSIPGNDPTPTMTNSLGMDLNVRISPFGTPWKYNAQEGKIDLPPECNPRQLFKNAEKLVPP